MFALFRAQKQPMQRARIGGINSAEEFISCGVPQGSVLGPLMFLLYINDFKNCSDLFEFHIFTDDANCFQHIKNYELVNIHLFKLSEWLPSNRLCLNFDKTNLVYSVVHKKESAIVLICI